jgi:hypothetical protein
MNEQDLVSAWHDLLLMFFFAFSDPVGPTFQKLLTGWVLATGRRTICGIIPFADPEQTRPHDAYHYLCPHARWFMSSLWKCWALFVINRFAPAGPVPLDLDDTLYHKSGKRVDGAGIWRDAVRSTSVRTVHALGLNLVLLTLRVRAPWGGEPLGIPINMRLHRKDGESLFELAAAMVREVAEWLPERQFSLCADGFYAALAGRGLPRTTFTSRLRRDAALYAEAPARHKGQRGRPRQKGARLPTPQKLAEGVRDWQRVQVEERGQLKERLLFTCVVLWYSVCGSRPVRLVISRDPAGKEEDDFFFTTDTSLQPRTVVGTTAGRWCIEDTFRNTKQFLGGEEPQVWKGKGPERAAGLSFLLYGLVWVWYLLSGYKHTALRSRSWYGHKEHPSFQDALYALRQVLWQERIFSKSEQPPAPAKILRLLVDALAACA